MTSVKINDVEVYQPGKGTSYTGSLTGTETGTVYTIVATDASGNQNATMSVTVYKDHDFTDFVVSEDTYSQTAPCNHLCGATYTSALPHGTIHWEYAYHYETIYGSDSGVQGKEARATYAKVELLRSVKGSKEAGVVVATAYVNCDDTCGNVADAVDTGNDTYAFSTYDPEDNSKAAGSKLLPVTEGDQEYIYSVHVTPMTHGEDGYAKAHDYAVHNDDVNRFNASIKYKPQLFDVPWKVTVEGLPKGVYPESINVKVMFAYDEDADDTETEKGYQVISQQATGHGVSCDISKDGEGNIIVGEDGSVSYEGGYPVWKFKGNEVDSYYHRILVVGYTYQGTYYDISGEVDDSVVSYHQYKSDNSATDHKTKTICYIPGTYSEELGTDDGAASGKILYTINDIHLPVVAFDYNDSDKEPSTKPVNVIQKSGLGEDVMASEIPGAAEGGVVTPVRENYDFLGWYTSATGGEKVTEIKNLTKSQTLYAHWKDIAAPEGKIAVKDSASVDYWTAYTEAEDITFDLYYNKKQTIQITATDNKDTNPKIQYYVTQEPKSKEQIEALADSQWSTYPDSGIGLNESGKYIIYARISDQAGNTTYLSSQGMIVDLINPAITGIETGKTYCLKQEFQVYDQYLKKVTVNGEEVALDENNSYCLMPSDTAYTVVATDIAGNVTTISNVRVNVAHTPGYKTEKNVIKAICAVDTCSLHNCEDKTVTLMVADVIYDGTAYDKADISVSDAFAEEVITTGKRTIALEYYEKDAKGEYETIDAPINSGTYYARVLVNKDDKTEAVCDYQKFEIIPKDVHVKAQDATSIYGDDPVEVVAVADPEEICNGDDLGVTATTEVTQNTNAGQYDIIPNCTNKNYHVIPENGTYTVERKAITDEMIHITTDQKDKKIILQVVDGERTLVEDVDYTYQKVEAGKNYDITITGIGNYKDVIEKTIENPNWAGNNVTVPPQKKPNQPTSTPTPMGAIPVDDIMKALGVEDKEEAEEIQRIALIYGVSLDTLKLTDKAIKKRKSDSDAKGTSFGRLKARAIKCKKNSLVLKWTKEKGADGYTIYGNYCNTKKKIYKYKKIATTNNKTFSRKMTKLKKGRYYKYLVVAYKKVGKKKITIASSVTVHATTLGGKFGVAKAVKLLKVGKKKKKLTKITLKKGKTAVIKAKEIRQNKNKEIRDHRPICCESSNKKIIKVTKKGKMKAVGKGKCKVWVYAQNGVYKTISVTVK